MRRIREEVGLESPDLLIFFIYVLIFVSIIYTSL